MNSNKLGWSWLAAGAALGLGLSAGVRAWRASQALSLHGRVVVITGARGLALAIAREVARQGAEVALLGRDAAALERACSELRLHNATCAAVLCDVRDEAQVTRAIGEVDAQFGRIDVLVNCAGIIQVTPLANSTVDDFDQAWATHVRGPLLLSRAAAPIMMRHGLGRIVNIASVGGLVAVPHLAPYCTSKFGLVGLSDALRTELRPHNIRVTTVCPGLMRTGSHVNAWVKGQTALEAAWFSVSDSAPGLSMSATEAARRIVAALRRGDARLDLGLPTVLARCAQALAPTAVAEATALANEALPNPGEDNAPAARVRDVQIPVSSWLTAAADAAVWSHNEAARPNKA